MRQLFLNDRIVKQYSNCRLTKEQRELYEMTRHNYINVEYVHPFKCEERHLPLVLEALVPAQKV